MSFAPVVMFTYNRLQHTSQAISYLQKNQHAHETRLIIYSDGPKNEEDAIKVNAVREYVKTVSGFSSVDIIAREKNTGLANNIIAGVTETVNKYGKVIVVEDDLLTSSYFLKYMNDGLNFYDDKEDVVSIHGYVYPVKHPLPETFFIKGADCWGWATWKRGWDIFNPDGKELLKELEGRDLTYEFDFNGTFAYTQMLKNQIEGRNNSWAIRWNASAFLQNKLTLYPGKSLVQNIGHDNSGVHSSASTHFEVDLYDQPVAINPIEIKPSVIGFEAFADYFRIINPPPLPKKKSLVTKIMKLFGKA